MEITLLREYLADIQSELMSLVKENSNEKDPDDRVSLDGFSVYSLPVLLNQDKHSVNFTTVRDKLLQVARRGAVKSTNFGETCFVYRLPSVSFP